MRVYIGYDSREGAAYKVAVASIRKYNKTVTIIPLIQPQLREAGIYYRDVDNSSTEFSLTRFLTPVLAHYRGMALFIDSDVVVQTNIENILKEANLDKAVSCVQHKAYMPKSNIKMDGQIQTYYPKKNWSSVMLFNCDHELIRHNLTINSINKESPSYLHRMEWAEGSIGSLSISWNYLVGYYSTIKKPNIIHYTDGGPWFENYKDCEFNKEWNSIYEEISNGNG